MTNEQKATAGVLGEINFRSRVRKGKVVKLELGQVAVFESHLPVLASGYDRLNVYGVDRCGKWENFHRFQVHTSIISLRRSVDDKDLVGGRFNLLSKEMMQLAQDFVDHEQRVIHSRIHDSKEIVYSDAPGLQKWFNDLKKEVVVLPRNATVDEEGADFVLVERTAVSLEILRNPTKAKTELVAWEDVGFFYEIQRK